MNKQQALDRLSALENEAKALRDIIEAPEKQDSLLTKPCPGTCSVYYCLTEYAGEFDIVSRIANRASIDLGGNFFQTEEIANHYAEALNTFLLLRHQPGTVAVADNVSQWGIEFCDDNIFIVNYISVENKINYVTPLFLDKVFC